ncbi:MAG: glycosyltransferase family 4 protein, partial [Acidobacteria bacterium]|nr:glycosyltransferase family 4 protein [Acidobacteriota bacterium]
LGRLADFHVVGYSDSRRFEAFSDGGHFHLAPGRIWLPLRLVLLALHALIVGARLTHAGKGSLVICEDPYVGALGLLLRELAVLFHRRVVLVIEVHGEWEKAPFLYHPRARWLAPLLHRTSAFVLRRADLLRTISEHLRSRVQKVAGLKPPLWVFPAFIDLDLFLQDPPRREGQKTVVFVGALSPVKGIGCLLDAFSEVHIYAPEARLEIVGEGPLRRAIQARRDRTLPLQRIELLGQLSQMEVKASLDRAAVLVLPSLSEGLGRVLIEAMARGLPVVASRTGGIPELVEDGKTGFLVEPGDGKGLAERILWLFEHQEEARAIGLRGREFVEKSFSSWRYFDGYAAIFEAAKALLQV